ncbi:MAG: TolB family protein [Dokdonella sp.]|uniref:TolB family protein n=1 Tax=Dokdonella sp. TaxID=2291710 RepID=UPI003F7D65B7
MHARHVLSATVASALLAACATKPPHEAGARVELDGDASVFLPGVVSSEYSEIRAALSPDGNTVLWGSTNRPGGAGGWDVWMSRRNDGSWSAPVAAAFDTPANEFDPAFAADGRTVYFFSNRVGGYGGDDLWQAAFDPASATFGAPVNLGAGVNSAGDEWAPSPSADGRSLLFSTNGRGGAGRHDLFTSAWRDGAWQAAVPIAGEVNGAGDDFDAAWLDGGRVLVFARSDDVDDAPIALWSAVRDGDRYVHAQPLDARVNVDGGWILGPSIDPAHQGVLLFSGERPGGQGRTDIHSIHYRVR